MSKEKSVNDSFLKEAEQNIINQARYMRDVCEVVDALVTFTTRYFSQYENRDEAIDALSKYRGYLYTQFQRKLADCFLFSGVGGEEAKKYSQEMFKEHFGDDGYCVMQFLDKHGQHPSRWYGDAEDGLREQAKEKIKEFDK